MMSERLKRPLFIAAFLCFAAAAPALADPPQLPAIADPATAEHHAGKAIFTELVTPDLAASELFYGGLFGWTFREIQTGAGTIKYAEADLHGRQVAGMIQRPLPAGGRHQPAWLTFLSAPDVNAATKTAERNGAKVLFPPHDVPGRGREAVFSDPQGAVFAVLASSSGDPSDMLADPGEWIWSSLITRDPDTDAAFYQAMFNYDVFDLPAVNGATHLLLASDGYARASANSMPSSKPDSRPHWLNYVRVKNVDKMTAKAVALGGHVIVGPHPDRHGGKISVVSDPTGAPFGLFEWADTESKKVAR